MAIGSAIYGRLATPLGSAIYDGIAPAGAPSTFAVWQVATDLDEYTFGANAKDLESLDVILRCVSDRHWPDRARAMYGTVHNYMQNAPLSVTGFTVIRCKRRGGKFQYQDSELFWHVGALYQIEIQQS